MNSKVNRIGKKYPLPTNSIIGKGLPTTSSDTSIDINDTIYSIHNRLTHSIRNNYTSLTSIDYVYIITHSNDILSDSNVYDSIYDSGSKLSNAISNAMISDSDFLNIYHYYSDIINSINYYSNIDNTDSYIIGRNTYYTSIAIRYLNISNMLNTIASNIGSTLTIASHNISIPTSVISSDAIRYRMYSNYYISKCSNYSNTTDSGIVYKEYAVPTSLDGRYTRTISSNTPTRELPTIPINNIKRGSDAMSLYTNDRCIRCNDKSIKDILPPIDNNIGISMSDVYSTICAMRIDSGTAPSVIWTGNSRDYLIIGIVDYDTTNYYVLYSSKIWTDEQIYDSIYNTYNLSYTSYHKYAMDTSIHKYHKVFNDPEYIKYAFDIQRGTVSKGCKTPKVGFIHNTFEYDDEYYIYKPYKGMFYDNMEDSIIYDSTIIPTRCIKCNACKVCPSRNFTYLGKVINNRTFTYYNKCIFSGTNFISSIKSLDTTKYFSGIIDSINSCDSYSDKLTIATRSINYIKSIISSIMINTNNTDAIDSLYDAIDSIMYYTHKDTPSISDYSLYTSDIIDPYTIRLHKGYNGIIEPTNPKPTYISGRLTRISRYLYNYNPSYEYQKGGSGKTTTTTTKRHSSSTYVYRPKNHNLSRHIQYVRGIKWSKHIIDGSDIDDAFIDRMLLLYNIEYYKFKKNIDNHYNTITNPYNGRK